MCLHQIVHFYGCMLHNTLQENEQRYVTYNYYNHSIVIYYGIILQKLHRNIRIKLTK